MTNAQAIAAIIARVNGELDRPVFDPGPPAAWRDGSKLARLADVAGLVIYTLSTSSTARVVHRGAGEITDEDVAVAADAILAHIDLASTRRHR